MHLMIRVNRDGMFVMSKLRVDASESLVLSPRAREYILAEMMKRDVLCKRCHLICRSNEIVNGLCSGVGCDIDVDRDVLALTGQEQLNALSKISKDVWRSIAVALPRNPDDIDPLPTGDDEW